MKNRLFTASIIVSIILSTFSAFTALAAGDSSSCTPPGAVCDTNEDMFGTPPMCNTRIPCAGAQIFNCSTGACYTPVTPPAGQTATPKCPSMTVGGVGYAAISLAANGTDNQARLIQCALDAGNNLVNSFYSSLAFGSDGSISNTLVKDITVAYTSVQCIADGGVPTDKVILSFTKCRFPVALKSGGGIKVNDQNNATVLGIDGLGNISNPVTGALGATKIRDNEGLEIWDEATFNANHLTLSPTGLSFTTGDVGIYSPLRINDTLSVSESITNADTGTLKFADPDGFEFGSGGAGGGPAGSPTLKIAATGDISNPAAGFNPVMINDADGLFVNVDKTTLATLAGQTSVAVLGARGVGGDPNSGIAVAGISTNDKISAGMFENRALGTMVKLALNSTSDHGVEVNGTIASGTRPIPASGLPPGVMTVAKCNAAGGTVTGVAPNQTCNSMPLILNSDAGMRLLNSMNNIESFRIDTAPGNSGKFGTNILPTNPLPALFSLFKDVPDGMGTAATGIMFGNPSQVTGWAQAGIWAVGSAGYNGSLIFGTDGDNVKNFNPTERMRLDSNGMTVTGNLTVTGSISGGGGGLFTTASTGLITVSDTNSYWGPSIAICPVGYRVISCSFDANGGNQGLSVVGAYKGTWGAQEACNYKYTLDGAGTATFEGIANCWKP